MHRHFSSTIKTGASADYDADGNALLSGTFLDNTDLTVCRHGCGQTIRSTEEFLHETLGCNVSNIIGHVTYAKTRLWGNRILIAITVVAAAACVYGLLINTN